MGRLFPDFGDGTPVLLAENGFLPVSTGRHGIPMTYHGAVNAQAGATTVAFTRAGFTFTPEGRLRTTTSVAGTDVFRNGFRFDTQGRLAISFISTGVFSPASTRFGHPFDSQGRLLVVTPPLTSTVNCWMSGEDLVGLREGQRVLSWRDRAYAPSSHAMVASTNASAPTFVERGINGRPAVEFDGGTQNLLGNSALRGDFGSANGFAVGIVLRHDDTLATGVNAVPFFVSTGAAGGNARFMLQIHAGGATNATQSVFRRLDADSSQGVFQSSAVEPAGRTEVIVMSVDFNGLNPGQAIISRNGVQTTATHTLTGGASQASTSLAVVLGSDGAGGSRWKGRIAEVMYIHRDTDAFSVTSLSRFLQAKYGLTVT